MLRYIVLLLLCSCTYRSNLNVKPTVMLYDIKPRPQWSKPYIIPNQYLAAVKATMFHNKPLNCVIELQEDAIPLSYVPHL